MMSCPIGIDWSVTHAGANVRLDDVVRYEGTGAAEAVHFTGLGAAVVDRYRQEIVSFARTAKEPFAGVEKVFADDFDRQQYRSFWDEYERLLAAAGESSGCVVGAATSGTIREPA